MFSEVVENALALEKNKRAELAHRLLESLNETRKTHELEQSWVKEVSKRIDAVRSGETQLVPAQQVHQYIRDQLRANKI